MQDCSFINQGSQHFHVRQFGLCNTYWCFQSICSSFSVWAIIRRLDTCPYSRRWPSVEIAMEKKKGRVIACTDSFGRLKRGITNNIDSAKPKSTKPDSSNKYLNIAIKKKKPYPLFSLEWSAPTSPHDPNSRYQIFSASLHHSVSSSINKFLHPKV